MKKTILIGSLVCVGFLYAGGSKNIIQPSSEAMAISNATTAEKPLLYLSDVYLGLGLGKFKLESEQSKEQFTSTFGTILAGFNANKYIGIEGRYTYGYNDISYDKGNNPKNINVDFNSKYSNIAIYTKLKYEINNFKPYILLGYGESKITNRTHGGKLFDFKEAGFQYGLGLGYGINNSWEVFVDYVKAYDDKGFDLMAQNQDVGIDLITVGVKYHF